MNQGAYAGSPSDQVQQRARGTHTARGRTSNMETAVGIACGACDAWNALSATACGLCGHDVSYLGEQKPARAEPRRSVVSSAPDARSASPAPAPLSPAPLSPAPSSPAPLSKEEVMEQARNYVCKECSTPVPSGPQVLRHLRCGGSARDRRAAHQVLRADADAGQGAPDPDPRRRGRRRPQLHAAGHRARGGPRGRANPLSRRHAGSAPRHANFVYENGQLVVRDEGSLNGVYVRVRGQTPARSRSATRSCVASSCSASSGRPRTRQVPRPTDLLLCVAAQAHPFRVVQMLAGGGAGMAFCATGPSSDRSAAKSATSTSPSTCTCRHARARRDHARTAASSLVDIDSKNGTYVRVKSAQPLHHGDYLFLGRQLLRVEITA